MFGPSNSLFGRSSASGRGDMLKTVGRAMTRIGFKGAALQDLISSSCKTIATSNSFSSSCKPKSSNHSSLSSSVFSYEKNPVSAIPLWHSSPESDIDCDRITVNGMIEEQTAHGFTGLGSVPSEDEVEDALFALQQVFGPTSQLSEDKYYYELDNDVAEQLIGQGLVGSELDWMEPSISQYNSRMLKIHGCDSVFYAFHLLQTEPLVQRMVKSLSSDKAVWDAVLNNEVVRQVSESFSADAVQFPHSPNETSNIGSHSTTNIVFWIFNTTKAKFMEVIEKITKIVSEVFQPSEYKTSVDAEGLDIFHEKLRTSFMLSIMILLVVSVSRALRAGHNLTT